MTEAPIESTSTFATPDHVLARNVGNEAVLLQLELEEYFGLDPVGRLGWELLTAGHDIGGAARLISEEYDVSAERAQSDLVGFAGQLLKAGLLIHVA